MPVFLSDSSLEHSIVSIGQAATALHNTNVHALVPYWVLAGPVCKVFLKRIDKQDLVNNEKQSLEIYLPQAPRVWIVESGESRPLLCHVLQSSSNAT
jgi:hypothetical protein